MPLSYHPLFDRKGEGNFVLMRLNITNLMPMILVVAAIMIAAQVFSFLG